MAIILLFSNVSSANLLIQGLKSLNAGLGIYKLLSIFYRYKHMALIKTDENL